MFVYLTRMQCGFGLGICILTFGQQPYLYVTTLSGINHAFRHPRFSGVVKFMASREVIMNQLPFDGYTLNWRYPPLKVNEESL